MKITHLSIFKIAKLGLFDNVNSYSEMNKAIEDFGKNSGSDYNTLTGEAFEIFNQYFCIRYNNIPLLGIKNIIDTSDDPFNAGYDFTYTDFSDKMGMIQSKWRSNTRHQFTLGELATNGAIANDYGIEKDNNILFINFDDNENLFDYKYKTARNARRIVDRKAQEEYILRDPKFWDDFRQVIKESSKTEFEEPYKLRDTQEWILNGIEKDDIKYEGTISVLTGRYNKGRVEASTGAGKTLCQFFNVKESLTTYNKNVAVMILPTISLISQTFGEFYKWKLFGSETEASNISCLIIMSGNKQRFNNQIADVLQTLNIEEAVDFVNKNVHQGKKVVILTTMKSHDLKYASIIDELKKTKIRIGLEIVDEYHNIISGSDRKVQLETAEYLKNNEDRTDGTIFYSASNKRGEILSSFDENLFGPLLCKVNRNELRLRAYVCSKLIFKFIKIKNRATKTEIKREALRKKLNIDKAQTEAAGVIVAYNDCKKYYSKPNMITFGDHVEGCRYIASSEELESLLPDVNNYFVAAETSSSERLSIFESIRNSGGNILHQHSVAKEGVNIPNLHGGILGRGLNIISIQQSIGRSDRALYEDTLNLQKGLIKLDNPEGWKKYYNIMYLIIDEDDAFSKRVEFIVRYLIESGIPESEWDISFVDDETKGGAKFEKPNYETGIKKNVHLDSENLKKMIQEAKINEMELRNKIEEEKEAKEINALSKMELLKKYL